MTEEDENYRKGKEYMARQIKAVIDGPGTAEEKLAVLKENAEGFIASREVKA